MFKLKIHKVEFFKGDREMSRWYIPITLVWLFVAMGEGGRILLLPNPLTVFLQIFVQAVLISTAFYVAMRYLLKWLVLILMPLFGVVAELIWCRGDIAAFSAQWGIPQPLVIVFWAVAWLIILIPPYVITKLKNVPVLLIFLGIAAFIGGTSWSDALKMEGLGGFGVILSLFLMVSGVVYWLYRKRKK